MNTISSGKSQKIIIVMWALVAEELGWRGYLQEKIEAHVGDVLTPLNVGIIWTVWHFSGNLFTNIHRLNPNLNTGRMEPYMIVKQYICLISLYLWCGGVSLREKKVLA